MSGPVLFVRGGALGDFVLTLPALHAMFASGREVHVAAAPKHRPLVALCGQPTRYWNLDGAECGWMFGGTDPVGYAEVVHFAAARAELPIAVQRFVAARPPANVPAWQHFASVLPCDPGLVLRAPPLRSDRPIVLAPGASDPSRSWPLPRWFSLAERLSARAPVVLVGGPSEPWAQYRPDLTDLIGLAASAAVWLGPDSGPTHLAARLGAPTLALFGPTSRQWCPFGARALALAIDDVAVEAEILALLR